MKKDLNQLLTYLQRAAISGIDVEDLISQIRIAINSSDTIKIVLMGAFSDGKTSTIAGVMGKLMEDMKIDQDESSDELTFYHLDAIGKQFEIVDTPGLFGTKERELDGKNVRYSSITREYLSSAHVIIYVTDAVNAMKDSHTDIIRYVLKDLGKLNSTIFVLNKMDEANVDMSDDEDYNRVATIKRDSLIKRLRTSSVALTVEEASNVRIACVAANPQGRGLKFWLEKPDKYSARSRIGVVKKFIEEITSSLDIETAKKNVTESQIKDSVLSLLKKMKDAESEGNRIKGELKEQLDELEIKLAQMRKDAILNKGILAQSLQAHQREIEIAINAASMNEIGTEISTYIGNDGKRLQNYISQKFSECVEQNNLAFKEQCVDSSFEKMSELTEGSIKWGARILKHTKVTNDMVKATRNVVAKGLKFKPWEAVKIARWVSKGLIGLSLALEAWSHWRSYKQQKEFEDTKRKVLEFVRGTMNEAEASFINEDTYLANFAPGITEGKNMIEEYRKNYDSHVSYLKSLRELLAEIESWSGISSEKYSQGDAAY